MVKGAKLKTIKLFELYKIPFRTSRWMAFRVATMTSCFPVLNARLIGTINVGMMVKIYKKAKLET